MSTRPTLATSIRDRLGSDPPAPDRFLRGGASSVRLDDLPTGTSLAGRAAELAGRSVLIVTRDQVAAALALIELDGVARRLIICTPDLPFEYLPAIVAEAGVDAIVCDPGCCGGLDIPLRVCRGAFVSRSTRDSRLTSDSRLATRDFTHQTEWILLTSGTTGAPKLLVHTLATLTAPLASALSPTAATNVSRCPGGPIPARSRCGLDDSLLAPAAGATYPTHPTVWGTFYDIRRYGGLQIFFRALLGRTSLVLCGAGEPLGDFLMRLGACRATHISGTPSHWRRVLMSAEARAIAPHYIRLSGEIADQGILNALQSFYPNARVSHAFASTEAGVGFEVADGLEGFPATLVGTNGAVQIKVEDGHLKLRSARNAARYLGDHGPIADDDGFVDTGDMVERRGDRYYFLGRRAGIINVGGLKVYPEEVEAAINRHPAVQMSMVRSTRSSITGALVAADVVLKNPAEGNGASADFKRQILQICHESLPPYKVPATIRFVPVLEVAAAGKLARHA